MSFFTWLSGKNSKAAATPIVPNEEPDSSGLTREDRTRPLNGRERPAAAAPAAAAFNEHGQDGAERKSRRHARRELLYIAVRESMTRGGVLSASYKFKVLSLDPHGEQFMVMMDLAQESGGETERLSELEALIAQTAKARFQVRVTAVYWRMNEIVTVGKPRASQPVTAQLPHGAPGPVVASTASVLASAAPVASEKSVALERRAIAPVPTSPPSEVLPPVKRRDPLLADEVDAFRKALAAASAQGASAADLASRAAAAGRVVSPDFEDTELPVEDRVPVPMPALSQTQYGDLN